VKVLFDVDVVLNLLLDRRPFSQEAGVLLSKAELGELSGHICATAVTTIYFLARKVIGKRRARSEVQKLLTFLEPAAVTRVVLESALESELKDFEDAVSHEAARQAGVDAIITRNVRDFKGTDIPAYLPSELAGMLEAMQ